MVSHHITDWSDAYTNGDHIPKGERWPTAWVQPSTDFRAGLGHRALIDQSYGDDPRHRFDLFLPEGEQLGLVVFVHGGYWMRLDKSYFSHLAAVPLAHGYAVAVPSYRLCPDVRIGEIVQDVGAAITAAAARVTGPIHLTGHSAGGHLVTRMISSGSPLAPDIAARIGNVVSISGLHDLRPLIQTGMNATLQIDEAEALSESPALLKPVAGARLTAWVGGAERAEFRRQNALLANIWLGLGATTEAIEEPDRHHFNILDGLADPDHALVRTLVG
jgi:acetyl esterase/lipase